jgi:hypothetical protein
MDMNENRYLLGLDIGQAHDPTAVAIIEHKSREATPTYRIRALHRYPLGTAYTAIADDILARLRTPPLARDTLVAIDATGVGAPVVDLIKSPRDIYDIYAITITGSTAVGGSGYQLNVPKRDLITKTAVLFQQHRIRIATTLPDTDELVDELLGYRIKTSDRGHHSYGPEASRDHDDLLLAVSLALWVGERRPATIPVTIHRNNARIPTQHDRFDPFWF